MPKISTRIFFYIRNIVSHSDWIKYLTKIKIKKERSCNYVFFVGKYEINRATLIMFY